MASLFGWGASAAPEPTPAASSTGALNATSPAATPAPTPNAPVAADGGGGGGANERGADGQADGEEDGEHGDGEQKKNSAETIHEQFPLDSLPVEIRLFETSYDLAERLALRDFRPFADDNLGCVTLSNLHPETEDPTKTDKDADDDGTNTQIQKHREALIRNTFVQHGLGGTKKEPKLTAARVCQIERRLMTDPTIIPDEADFRYPDVPADYIKKEIRRTYGKIKRHSFDLTEAMKLQIEQRINILKDV